MLMLFKTSNLRCTIYFFITFVRTSGRQSQSNIASVPFCFYIQKRLYHTCARCGRSDELGSATPFTPLCDSMWKMLTY